MKVKANWSWSSLYRFFI